MITISLLLVENFWQVMLRRPSERFRQTIPVIFPNSRDWISLHRFGKVATNNHDFLVSFMRYWKRKIVSNKSPKLYYRLFLTIILLQMYKRNVGYIPLLTEHGSQVWDNGEDEAFTNFVNRFNVATLYSFATSISGKYQTFDKTFYKFQEVGEYRSNSGIDVMA